MKISIQLWLIAAGIWAHLIMNGVLEYMKFMLAIVGRPG